MAVKIRLARAGAKKRPFYRIVVTDVRNARDGKFIERVGSYDPFLAHNDPQRVRLQEARIKHWLSVGALPTDRVALFLGHAGYIPVPAHKDTPQKSAPKKKAQERMQTASEAKMKAKAKEEAQEVAEEAVAVQEVQEAKVSETETETKAAKPVEAQEVVEEVVVVEEVAVEAEVQETKEVHVAPIAEKAIPAKKPQGAVASKAKAKEGRAAPVAKKAAAAKNPQGAVASKAKAKEGRAAPVAKKAAAAKKPQGAVASKAKVTKKTKA
jgi:small subunit ribosomal protein S16